MRASLAGCFMLWRGEKGQRKEQTNSATTGKDEEKILAGTLRFSPHAWMAKTRARSVDKTLSQSILHSFSVKNRDVSE